MSNNRRRQRKKLARRQGRAGRGGRELPVVSESEASPPPVEWNPYPSPAQSWQSGLIRESWAKTPDWWKALDYRERLASDIERRAEHNALLVPGSKTEPW